MSQDTTNGPYFDMIIEVDEYLERMYTLMQEGWFIHKVTKNRDGWKYVLINKDKMTRKLFVK